LFIFLRCLLMLHGKNVFYIQVAKTLNKIVLSTFHTRKKRFRCFSTVYFMKIPWRKTGTLARFRKCRTAFQSVRVKFVLRKVLMHTCNLEC
jgi:hypothetical protein